MALARSASGPGGLSINTGSANTFGASASSQPPPAGGLFGASTIQTAPSTGLFGTAPAAGASTTGGSGLFGSGLQTTATSQAAAGGGLFGTGTAGATAPAQTGSLFGAATNTAAAAPTQPSLGGGLFGSAAAATTQAPTGGGLFGSTTTAAAPAAGGGLFGSTMAQPQQQQQQQPAASGLFGSSSAFGAPQQPAAAKPSTGLFGINQTTGPPLFPGGIMGAFGGGGQQTQQPQGSLFGRTMGSQVAPPPGLTMGQSTNQQQVVPGVRIDLSNLKATTRFNDLQETLQKEIIALDRGIQAVMQQSHDVDAFMPAHGEQLSAIPNDVRFVTRKYDGASTALSSDAQAVKAVRELVRVDADHAKLSFKAVDNLKLPAQYHTAGLWSGGRPQTHHESAAAAAVAAASASASSSTSTGDSNSDLISFFSRTADEMDALLRRLRDSLGEIESHMQAVSSNLFDQLQRAAATRAGPDGGASSSGGGAAPASAAAGNSVAELAEVLRGFEESIMTVASKVGSAREGVTGLQLGEFMGTNGLDGGGAY